MRVIDRSGHNDYQRSYYDSLRKPTMQPARTPYVHRHVDRMIRHARLERPQRILEVGAGLGRFSLPLLARGFGLTCVDLSRKMLDRLAAEAPEAPLRTLAIDIADAGAHFREEFDRVIGFFTLHHLHDLESCFRGIFPLAAPGAVIAFCEPVAYNPLYYVQMAVRKDMTWKGDGGIVRMRAGRVLPAMEAAGFRETERLPYGFFPPFVTNTAAGRRLEDALERARIFGWAHAFQIFLGRKPA